MTSIGTETFVEDGVKNYIRLSGTGSGGQYLRRIDISNDWSEINIGVLYSIEATGSHTGSGLWIGLGTSVDGNVGLKNWSSSYLSYHVGTGLGTCRTQVHVNNNPAYKPNPYFSDISGSYFGYSSTWRAAFSASAIQASGGTVTTYYVMSSENPPRKSFQGMTISKTSDTSLAVRGLFCNKFTGSVSPTGSSNHNYTNHALFSTVNQSSLFEIDGRSLTVGSGVSLTGWDAGKYPLNMVNLVWTGSYACRIYEITVGVSE